MSLKLLVFSLVISTTSYAGLYDSCRDGLSEILPGDHNAWSKAIEAGAIQTGIKDNVNRTESYATATVTKYSDDAGVTPYIGSAAYAYKVYRDKKIGFPMIMPLIGRLRVTAGIQESQLSEIMGLFGFTQSIKFDTLTGSPTVTLGFSRGW
jgi:hypothetical protein